MKIKNLSYKILLVLGIVLSVFGISSIKANAELTSKLYWNTEADYLNDQISIKSSTLPVPEDTQNIELYLPSSSYIDNAGDDAIYFNTYTRIEFSDGTNTQEYFFWDFRSDVPEGYDYADISGMTYINLEELEMGALTGPPTSINIRIHTNVSYDDPYATAKIDDLKELFNGFSYVLFSEGSSRVARFYVDGELYYTSTFLLYLIDKPEDPIKTGYKFDGWFTNDGQKWIDILPIEDEMLVNDILILFASFTKIFDSGQIEIPDPPSGNMPNNVNLFLTGIGISDVVGYVLLYIIASFIIIVGAVLIKLNITAISIVHAITSIGFYWIGLLPLWVFLIVILVSILVFLWSLRKGDGAYE